MDFFKQFDFLSTEAKFTFNKNGETRVKTFIGGIISIISVLASLGLSLYFFAVFVSDNNQSIISSSKFDSTVYLTDTSEVPLMFRLSDTRNLPYKESDKMYKIGLNYWYVTSNTSTTVIQDYVAINIEHCDINKHFGKYKELFQHYEDIGSFYCPAPREKNLTIYGIYGNNSPFSYYHFYFYLCLNQTKGEECMPVDKITEQLKDTYIDMRYIDFAINNNNSYYVKTAYIRTDRFMTSVSIFKRIWVYFDWIEYKTDRGIVFTKERTEQFHQLSSFRYDVDLRDIYKNPVSSAFLNISILSSGKITGYRRHFQKLQDYIATIGGLIKCISTFAFILNYYVSQNSYYFKLMQNFPFENYLDSKGSIRSKLYDTKGTVISCQINKNQMCSNDISKIKRTNIRNTLNRKTTIKLECYKKFVPIIHSVNKSNTLRFKFEVINQTLNIFDLMKLIEKHRQIKQDLLSQIKQDYLQPKCIDNKEKDCTVISGNNNKKKTVLFSLKNDVSNQGNNYNDSHQNIISNDMKE